MFATKQKDCQKTKKQQTKTLATVRNCLDDLGVESLSNPLIRGMIGCIVSTV